MNISDTGFMEEAYSLARKSFDEGGIPIGAVLVRGSKVIGRGHNRRIQRGDPILHGEMDCLRDAGRQQSYRSTVLYTTLSPCMMCSGAIIQFKIPKIVIGENVNFGGNEEFLRQCGVDVVIMNDQSFIDFMKKYIDANPEIWNEDIAM